MSSLAPQQNKLNWVLVNKRILQDGIRNGIVFIEWQRLQRKASWKGYLRRCSIAKTSIISEELQFTTWLYSQKRAQQTFGGTDDGGCWDAAEGLALAFRCWTKAAILFRTSAGAYCRSNWFSFSRAETLKNAISSTSRTRVVKSKYQSLARSEVVEYGF